jgi:hypothetical protein
MRANQELQFLIGSWVLHLGVNCVSAHKISGLLVLFGIGHDFLTRPSAVPRTVMVLDTAWLWIGCRSRKRSCYQRSCSYTDPVLLVSGANAPGKTVGLACHNNSWSRMLPSVRGSTSILVCQLPMRPTSVTRSLRSAMRTVGAWLHCQPGTRRMLMRTSYPNFPCSQQKLRRIYHDYI